MAGLFGGRLARHATVTLLGSWKEGLEALRKQGIRLEKNGHVEHARVKVAADPADCTGAQTALVLVKSWQSEHAANMLAACLAPDGVALTLQNGLGNIETLQARIGRERVALGVTTSGAALLGPGRVRDGGAGPTHVAPHPRLAPLVDLLQTAGIEIYPADDIEGLVWGKLAINAGINPLSALLEVPNGELIRRPEARLLMGEAALEVASVAEARGIRLPFANPVEQMEQVAQRTAENDSSMLQDIRRGAPTEINAINGAVVREGQRLGVSAPVNRILWKLVQAKVGGT
ncbi:MAG: 2-dehydropantoate 2-reductase [Gammaproteobacteria bacterium]|nr:MAG: 2-dehydropantoate 2-reductase [Gammaproteobacteria bacterium]